MLFKAYWQLAFSVSFASRGIPQRSGTDGQNALGPETAIAKSPFIIKERRNPLWISLVAVRTNGGAAAFLSRRGLAKGLKYDTI